MNMHSVAKMSGQENGEPWYLAKRNRGVLFRRFLVMFLLLDLAATVLFAQSVSGDFSGGFYWPHPGMMLFPFPLDASSGMHIPTMTPLNLPDVIVYSIFVLNGIWAVWTAVALIYIVYPVLVKLRARPKKP